MQHTSSSPGVLCSHTDLSSVYPSYWSLAQRLLNKLKGWCDRELKTRDYSEMRGARGSVGRLWWVRIRLQFPLKFIEKLPLTPPISFEHIYLKVTFPLQAERCFQSNAEFTSEHHGSAPRYQQPQCFTGIMHPSRCLPEHINQSSLTLCAQHSAEEAWHLSGSDKEVMFHLQPTWPVTLLNRVSSWHYIWKPEKL